MPAHAYPAIKHHHGLDSYITRASLRVEDKLKFGLDVAHDAVVLVQATYDGSSRDGLAYGNAVSFIALKHGMSEELAARVMETTLQTLDEVAAEDDADSTTV